MSVLDNLKVLNVKKYQTLTKVYSDQILKILNFVV